MVRTPYIVNLDSPGTNPMQIRAANDPPPTDDNTLQTFGSSTCSEV